MKTLTHFYRLIPALVLAACGAPLVGGNAQDAGDAEVAVVDVPSVMDVPTVRDVPNAPSCDGGEQLCNGVCTSTQADPANCGACGTRCPNGQSCVMGRCALVCPDNFTICDGVCRDLRTDNAHCGMCGTQCPAGQACMGGQCMLTCAMGQTVCSNTCVNTQSDRANCGMCGNACGDGLVCESGMCVPSCRMGHTNCMGSCTSTDSDPRNCGMCGTVCGPYANAVASCGAASCIMTCNRNFADCNMNRMDGCEANTSNDINNCGACGNACNFANGAGACVNGSCQLMGCNMGFENCDAIDSNGCECRVQRVGGMNGVPLGMGTFTNAREDAMRGGVIPDGMVVANTDNFFWIVNTAESTVSKWDAAMDPPREIAKYRVGLEAGECRGTCCHANGCNMASRIAIDGAGDVYVANRGFAFQGTVTKLAGSRANCIDRNMNGVIDTSTGPMNVLAYTNAIGQPVDECVLWTARVGPVDAILRALTVDRGDRNAPAGYPWAGSYNRSEFYKLNPVTGETIATVAVPVRPYGAVVTGDGRLWVGSLDSGATASIDTTTPMPVVSAAIPFPLAQRGGCVNGYGIAADGAGRLWFAGWTCRDALGYAPGPGAGGAGGTWSRVDTTAQIDGYAGRGITPGPDGFIYMAGEDPAENNSRVVRWLATDHAMGAIPAARVTRVTTPALRGPAGLGFDRLGRLYLAHWGVGAPLARFDPMTMMNTTYAGPNQVYSYSDFTGSVRRLSIPEGSYSQTTDAMCANPRPSTLTINADVPMGTAMTVSVRTAATVLALGAATDVPIATLPPNGSPYDVGVALRAAGITPAQMFRVTVRMRAAMDGSTPVLRGYNLAWTCP